MSDSLTDLWWWLQDNIINPFGQALLFFTQLALVILAALIVVVTVVVIVLGLSHYVG